MVEDILNLTVKNVMPTMEILIYPCYKSKEMHTPRNHNKNASNRGKGTLQKHPEQKNMFYN